MWIVQTCHYSYCLLSVYVFRVVLLHVTIFCLRCPFFQRCLLFQVYLFSTCIVWELSVSNLLIFIFALFRFVLLPLSDLPFADISCSTFLFPALSFVQIVLFVFVFQDSSLQILQIPRLFGFISSFPLDFIFQSWHCCIYPFSVCSFYTFLFSRFVLVQVPIP